MFQHQAYQMVQYHKVYSFLELYEEHDQSQYNLWYHQTNLSIALSDDVFLGLEGSFEQKIQYHHIYQGHLIKGVEVLFQK
jgi:hypothetical protein